MFDHLFISRAIIVIQKSHLPNANRTCEVLE